MAGRGVRALSVVGVTTVGVFAASSTALGAVSFPRSDGSDGPCNLSGTLDTLTTPFGVVVDPGGGNPQIRVVNCTTLTIGSGNTLRVSGPYALELRATGAVTIDGTLDASGFAGSSGATSGAAGPGGLTGGGAGGTTGAGGSTGGLPSGGGGGGAGMGGAGGTGGAAGPNSGSPSPASAPATNGGTPSTSNYGGGGGGGGRSATAVNSRGVASSTAAPMRGGSGGGGGGGSSTGTFSIGGRGGGGGGAVRIIAEGPITVPASGAIRAQGGVGGPASEPGPPYGGGGGGGSGGVIDLIGPTIGVSGTVNATGGLGALGPNGQAANGGNGGGGRVRFLANNDPPGGLPAHEYMGEHSVAIETTASGAGSGTITSQPAGISCPPDCSEPFDPDTSLTLTASPGTGSNFAGWSGDCSGADSSCNLLLDDAHPDNRYATNAAFGVPSDGGTQPPADPQPPGKGRPDLAIGRAGRKAVGDDLYGSNGAGQTAGVKLAPGSKASFAIELENDGDAVDGTLVGAPRGTGGFKLKYSLAGRKVTKQITGTGLPVEGLAPGATRMLTVSAKAGRSAESGSRQKFLVSGRSAGDPSLMDAVRMKLRVAKP
jgi:hypothetical protein